MMRKAILILSMLLSCGTALAQEKVADGVVDGRQVELFEDGTWRYASDENNCRTLSARVAFCGNPGWSPTNSTNPDVLAAYRHDDRHYAQIIAEAVGRKDGLTENNVREFAIEYARSASTTPVAVSETSTTDVGGRPAKTLVYNASISGVEIVFVNTFVLEEHNLLQLQTWQVGGMPYTDTHRALHAEFIAAIRLTD